MPLSPNYNPNDNETQIYTQWMDAKIGNPKTQPVTAIPKLPQVKTHTILMPPPNLTGDLHAGHAFQHYLMDTLSRLARQRGEKNLWFPGVDHAGLQLEGVIDKQIKKGEFDEIIKSYLEGDAYRISKNFKQELYNVFYVHVHACLSFAKTENLHRNIDNLQNENMNRFRDGIFNYEVITLGTEDQNKWMENAKTDFMQFIIKDLINNKENLPKYLKTKCPDLWLECAWSKVNLWRDNQKNQSAILGDTPDYDRSLFTLDPQNLEMVNYAFTKYWQDGLIYKGSYLVNWSVGLQTALSDVAGEIEYEKRIDPFVTFEYELGSWAFADYSFKGYTSEQQKHFEHLLDKITNYFNNNKIQVSTTRPETIFGDKAVAMHPDILRKKLKDSNFEKLDYEYFYISDADIEEIIKLIENKFFTLWFRIFFKTSGTMVRVEFLLADEVDPNFGSGSLKITPANDIVDYEIFNKYIGGDFESAIGRDGKLTEICGNFVGQTVNEARANVIKALVENGFVPKKNTPSANAATPQEGNLRDSKKYFGIEFADGINPEDYQIDWNYVHNVTICERTKTVVEPLISEEFFISYHKEFSWAPLAKDLSNTIVNKGKKTTLQKLGIEAVNQTNFHSPEYKDRGINFLENIKDWCISRDLIWGHKMPVWYNLDTNPERIFYSYEQVTANPELSKQFQIDQYMPDKYGNWVQEEKILDTWFSSCLWPLSTLKYPEFVKSNYDTAQSPSYFREISDKTIENKTNFGSTKLQAIKPNIIFLGGGDVFEHDVDYQTYLKNSRIRLDSTTTRGWRSKLQEDLKPYRIEIIAPRMPSKDNAKYADWKIVFDKIVPFINPSSILIGHSLGGSFLLKYLSENRLKIDSINILAAPKTGCFDFDTADFGNLNSYDITLHHSTDDFVVNYDQFIQLQTVLPNAKATSYDNYNHFLIADFPDLTQIILKKFKSDNEQSDFATHYPTQQMTTGKDIFYQWIVRMTMLSYYFTAEIPYQDLIITPTILDDKGKKMSKSLGNGMDPVAQIDKFSSDSMRMAMLGGMIPDRNIKMGGRLADELCEKYRNFGNKMWNVARFFEYKEEKVTGKIFGTEIKLPNP